MTFKENIDQFTLDALNSIGARVFPEIKKITRKGEKIAALENFLKNEKARFVELLDKSSKLLLAEIAWSGKVPDAAFFKEKYGESLPKRDTGSFQNQSSPVWLLASYDHYNDRMVPVADVETFRPFVPEPPKPQVQAGADLPESVGDYPLKIFRADGIVFQEARRVLSAVKLGRVKVTTTGRPSESAVRNIREILLLPDYDLEFAGDEPEFGAKPAKCGPVRAHAWAVIVQQMGWAKKRGESLKLTPEGEKWLSDPTPQGMGEAVEQFVWDNEFYEINRIPHIRGQSGKAKNQINPPGDFRSRVFTLLQDMPSGEWVKFEDFFKFMVSSGMLPRIVDSRYPVLHVGDAYYGETLSDSVLKKQVARAILMEYFATLGILAIAYTPPHYLHPDYSFYYEGHSFLGRYDGLYAIQLSPLGEFLCGRTSNYALPAPEGGSEASVKALPNFDLVIGQQGDPLLRNTLSQFAKKTSDHVWKLDVETVIGSLQKGSSIEEVRRAFEEVAGGNLPGTVADWWARIEAKAGACEAVEPAFVVTWRDEEGAATLANASGIGRLCTHLGGRRLCVAKKNWSAFTREAAKLGLHVPAKSGS